MAKQCGYPECSTEISEWQEYCVEHYVKVQQEGLPEEKGETMEQKKETMDFIVDEQPRQDSFENIQPTVKEVKEVQEEPVTPQLSQEQIKAILQREQMKLQQEAQKKMQQQPKPAVQPKPKPAVQQKPVTKPKTKVPSKVRTEFSLPEKISDQQRMTVKMYALQSAVQMLSNMGYDNNFKAMIEDVRTLTSHFFRIVIERNEKL